MSIDVHSLDQFLLVGAAVLLLAVLAVRLTVRVGFPSLLAYLMIGMLIGEDGLGVPFEDYAAAHALGFAALVVILAEGGLTTPWPKVRPVLRLGVALATVGVAVSVLVVSLVAHYLLGLDWQLAVLLGAVYAPTDSAAVFSVLRRVPLPSRVSAALEAESGFNDAPTVVLVTLVSTSASGSWWQAGLQIGYELVAGLAIGALVGFGAIWVLRRVALPASGLYPIAVMAFAVLAYSGAAAVHASGFAAVYVAAVVLGNTELPHRAATRSFAEGLAWLAQIGLFVMLGLLASPSRIGWDTVLMALLSGLALTVLARPLSVLVSSLVQRLPLNELAFVSWAGLRGAVPIVLATIPLAEGVRGAERLFDIVFVMVVIYTLLTGPSLPWVAKVVRVARRSEPRELEVEAAALERMAADLLQVTISPKSLMHGVEVGELRLPKGASVALIVRDGEFKVPEPRSVLRHGDDVLVVTPRKLREATDARLRSVSLNGRLARWVERDPHQH